MAQYFVTVVYVINADDADEADEYAEQLVSAPDCPAFVDKAWVDEVEKAENVEPDEEEEHNDPMDWDD